jgi:hypothetical protein
MAKKRKPFNKSTGRDYTYDTAYQASEEQKKNRASRNAARAKLMREGKVHKGDGKDVDHQNSNPRDNSSKNLGVLPKSKNRGKVGAGEGGRAKGRPRKRKK